MVRTKVTPRVGQRKGTQVEAHAPSALPSPDELQRRREEVGRLEEVGRTPRSLLTWQQVQMVAEVGSLVTAGAEPASRIRPKVGGRAPHKEFLKRGLMKRPQKYQLGMVTLHEICWYQMSTELLIGKCSFFHLVCKITQECWSYYY